MPTNLAEVDAAAERLRLITWVRGACRDGTAQQLRKAAGLTCDELGASCGVTGSAISLVERGKRSPRTEFALAYARVLRVLDSGCGCMPTYVNDELAEGL